MPKLHPIQLTPEQRELLQTRLRQGGLPARVLARIRTLLWSDEGLPDAAIAQRLETSTSSIERTRKRFASGGLHAALTERPRPGAAPVLDGKGEALLIELACSKPPAGQERWTLRQLGQKLVALEVVETISHETIRRVLKKTNSSPGRSARGACRR
jgi:putative transposase